jgi:MFS family permease
MLIKEGKVVYRPKEKEKLSFGGTLSRIYPNPRKYPIYTWCWLTRFFISMAYCSGSYNTIMLMQRYKLSQDETSKTVTILSIVTMLFLATSALLGGLLSDKFRKQKPFVVASTIVVGIGVVINIFAPSVTYVVISSIISSFGYGIFLAVDVALVARILPNKNDTAKDFGIMNIANTIPQSIVPFIAPTLLSIGSWPFLFGSLAIFALLSALAVIPIPEMSPKLIGDPIEG